MRPPVSEWGLRKVGNVILIVGPPETGKTVLAYNVADGIRKNRKVYVAMSKRYGRPDYYRPWRPERGFEYDNAVVMLNDASLAMHARRYMSAGNVVRDMRTAIRRHHRLDIIYDVQNAGTLDVNAIRATDALCLKGPPSPLQIPTERPAIRDKYEEAGQAIDTWKQTNAYVVTHRKSIVVTGISPPGYWNEDISTDDLLRKEEMTLKERVRRMFE